MKGITLIELLVSVVIISIMMGGIFAASQAVLNIDRGETARSAVFIRAQSIVSTIESDAINAEGMGTGTSSGVWFNNPTDFCFRNDPAGVNPWACYSRLAGNVLYRCLRATTGACTTFDTAIGVLDNPVAARFTSGVFTMPIVVSDATLINSAVTLDVVVYPEKNSF